MPRAPLGQPIAENTPVGDAVADMLAEAGEFDPPNPIPHPMIHVPVRRPVFPKPDWRAEEEARVAAEHASQAGETDVDRRLRDEDPAA